MPDKQKIIKGLEVCTSIADGESCPKDCPYYQKVCYGYNQLMCDALALLKEQEEQIDRLIEESASNAEMAEGMKELLKEQEALVRCKDCKYCYFASNRIKSEQSDACGKHGIDVTQDWFCADGEAKE